ncbi:MAG: prolipoprotein diacylglyceryl transferase [Deltaproteobacteria bacterium]|nr:prolipoprotein diacylglyceryl transferase [Deltaproteobacteria bacterium]
MFPTIVRLGPLAIHTYGVLVATAFLAGVGLAMREARRLGQDPTKVMDLSLYIVISAIVGSRLLYVLLKFDYYIKKPLNVFMIWEGGLVFYGGLIGALIVGLWYMRRHGLNMWLTCDIFAPSLPLGQAIGRLGCFSAGCCYGSPTDVPWAVTFTNPETLASPLGVPIHPTQLYSSAIGLVIFLILMLMRKHKKFDGQLVWTYVVLSGIGRFFDEFCRADFRGPEVFGVISTTQAISIVSIVLGVVMLIVLGKKHQLAPTPNP